MYSVVVVTLLCLLGVAVSDAAAAGTVKEKRCGISNSQPSDPPPPVTVTKVTLPDFSSKDNSDVLTSQQFSQNYSGPLILEWTIRNSLFQISKMVLKLSVNLTDSTNCLDEYLEVSVLKDNSSSLVLKTCGDRVFEDTTFLFSEPHFKLYLQDAQKEYGISFSFNKILIGQLHLFDPPGEIVNANYPTPSTLENLFAVKLVVTPFRKVKLTVNDYNISNTDCGSNTILTASPLSSQSPSGNICNVGGNPLIAKSNYMLVLMRAKANVVHFGRGFNLTYDEVPYDY